MNNFFKSGLFAMTLLVAQTLCAEEKICVPAPCQNNASHIAFSREKATVIAVGTFSFAKASTLLKMGEHEFMEVQFTPKKLLKGDGLKPHQKLQIPLMGPLIFNIGGAPKKGDLFAMWQVLLRPKDQTLGWQNYEKFEQSISGLVKTQASSSVNLALVKVTVGSLDNKLREATVPVFEGQEYVFFLFKDYVSGDGTLFPWELNLYPYELYKTNK